MSMMRRQSGVVSTTSVKKRGKRKLAKRAFKNKIMYGLVAGILVVSCFLIYSFLSLKNPIHIGESGLKAVIVDQLSTSNPNQTFWQTAQTILTTAGYKTYYYCGVAVTVDFYRNLATHGFDLIILRVHSALYQVKTQSNILALFTSEPFEENKAGTNYLWDCLHDPPRLVKASAPVYECEYFAVTPQFVKDIPGQFDNSVIVMMGCDGLTYATMADAFTKKGAKAYISWDGPVSPSHTDEATIKLLTHLVTEKQAVRNAVTQTNNEMGCDPTYKSRLSYYP